MKLFVISDNTDTKMGLRLCGIEGVVVNDEPSFRAEVEKCLSDSEIGILLVTEKLVKLAPDYINGLKLGRSLPLIVEIPDRHGAQNEGRHKFVYQRSDRRQTVIQRILYG
jgi:ATP synthase, subunit F